jgi:hypothetical protein
MKLFQCQCCGQPLYFENVRCEGCGHRLGFLADRMVLSALEPDGDRWQALAASPAARYRFCSNAEFDVCNWLVDADCGTTLCRACDHNQVIPDLAVPGNLAGWRKLEFAKHRLIYALRRLGLPLVNRTEDPEQGLGFDFLAAVPDQPKVMTGHDDGLITLALAEADDAKREQTRQQMGEPYRTLLGHLRHEVGHYYWDRLVRDGGRLEPFRSMFGDERQDYAAALRRNYENGPPPDWAEHYISSYASCHPWEDFAETWAHYLRIVDTLDTGFAFGLQVRPRLANADDLQASIDFDPYGASDVARLIEAWLPLVVAVNSLNRAMGLHDLYPFVLTPTVIEKVGFIHNLVHGASGG